VIPIHFSVPFSSNVKFPIFIFQQFFDNYYAYSMALSTMSFAITSLNVMPQDLSKLDRFDGNNKKGWKQRVEFLLTTSKVRYVLDTPCPIVPTKGASREQIDAKLKREEDNYT
jgi:hypothetical protein